MCINIESDIGVCGTIDVSETEQLISKSKKLICIMTAEETLKEIFIEKYIYSVIWGKLFKRELFQNIEFKRNMKIAEDLEKP